MADPFEKKLSGFRHISIQHGDTLQVIAERELGDASLWYELVEINNLVYPYITDNIAEAGPRVFLSGATLVIPATVTTISANVDPDLVFGTDCALKGGLLFDDGNGDISVVSGRANLRQALGNRIVTEKRDLLYHPRYGCLVRRLLGAVNGPTASLLAAQYLKSALKEESRIDTVNKVTAAVLGDRIEVDAEVTPISGRAIDLTIEV